MGTKGSGPYFQRVIATQVLRRHYWGDQWEALELPQSVARFAAEQISGVGLELGSEMSIC